MLDGAKIFALAAPLAKFILISARSGGAPGETEGISLFLVPADQPGISIRPYRTVDGRSKCEGGSIMLIARRNTWTMAGSVSAAACTLSM